MHWLMWGSINWCIVFTWSCRWWLWQSFIAVSGHVTSSSAAYVTCALVASYSSWVRRGLLAEWTSSAVHCSSHLETTQRACQPT